MEDDNDDKTLTKFCLLPQRIILAIMGFFAIVCGYTMRICLSDAITRIVVPINHTTSEKVGPICDPHPDFHKNVTENMHGLYHWNQEEQGLILSAFYAGYVITQVPGGLLAEKFGGKWTLAIGLLVGAIFTLLTPISIYVGGARLLAVVRFFIGLGQGVMYPSVSILIVQWVPIKERGSLGVLMLGGGQFGVIMANSISGLIMNNYDWSMVFYFFGTLNLVWLTAFILLCTSDPSTHPYLTKKERDYLTQEMGTIKQYKGGKVPWLRIFTNVEVICLIIGQFGYDFGFFIMITDLPKYMSDVMSVSIKNNGFYSSLPFWAMWLASLAFGSIGDALIRSGFYSVTASRKTMSAICTFIPAIFLVAASYAGCNTLLVVAFFAIAMGFMGSYYGGIKLGSMDLSPNYAGTLMGITNGIGSLNGFISPFVVGELTPHATLMEWRRVFWLTFLIKCSTGIVYLLFVTANVQDFNDDGKEE